MGLQDSRLWQWAANQFYANNGSGNAWRNGTTPTKLEPSGADLADGLANDVDTRAEVMNHMLNAQDSVRNGLLLDRLATFSPQVDLHSNTYSPYRPDVSFYDVGRSGFGTPASSFERASGVFSMRRRTFVHLMGGGAAFRLADGRHASFGSPAVTQHASINEWSRGVYVDGAAAASSWAVLLNVGASTAPQLQTVSDSGVVQAPAVLAGHTILDANPICTGTGAASRVRLLTASGSVAYLTTYNPAANTWSAVSTGLTSAGIMQLHRLESGRLWVTTAVRAAYSDNDGVTWNFDGAAAGSSQGEFCVYDASNARWVRFSYGTNVPGGMQVSTASNPNNPTARAILKSIAGLAMMSEPVVWGRFVYAVMFDVAGSTRPYVSPDYGISWLPCSEHFFETSDSPGPVGAQPPLSSANLHRMTVSGIGVVATFRNAAGTNQRTRMLCLKPLAEVGGGLLKI